MHCHLLGTGDSGSGCTTHPHAHQWWHPIEVARRATIVQAACVPKSAPSVDVAYVERLRALTVDFPVGARWLLFALDHAYDAGRDSYGNPLLARAPLALGVRTIVAHAASLGHAADLDRPSAPKAAAFDLWARLMDERSSEGLLYADISAAFQNNRTPAVRRALVTRDDWHPRLLHGSDHPLPGVMPLFDPARLVAAGLLAEETVAPLREIRAHNPLLFDFVQKRSLRIGSRKLSEGVFETGRMWGLASQNG